MPMLTIIENPGKAKLARLVGQTWYCHPEIWMQPCGKYLDDVKSRGDQAVADYSLQFDQSQCFEPSGAGQEYRGS